MNTKQIADIIDRLKVGSFDERIAADNIVEAARRGCAFVTNTTAAQRDPMAPIYFKSEHHQALAIRSSALASAELQLICDRFAGRVAPNEHA
jgi:hypothetical protein